ncbi:hypothetical protein BH20ACI2_BH20ACI2_24990 [soil metagenome]
MLHKAHLNSVVLLLVNGKNGREIVPNAAEV